MQHSYFLGYYCLLVAVCCFVSANLSAAGLVSVHDHAHQLSFVENKGQWHSNVRFRADLGDLNAVFLERDLFTFVYYHPDDVGQLHALSQASMAEKNAFKLRGHTYKVRFMNANVPKQLTSEGLHRDYNNYFIGKDRNRWKSHVPIYDKITYPQLYQGIDLMTYSRDLFFKYDFIVAPHADPSPIQMYYEGADRLFIDDEGNLNIVTSVGTIVEQRPYAYQSVGGEMPKDIPCRFVLCGNNAVSFDFPKGYNHQYALVIDPVLVGATLSGSTSTNYGHCATYDGEGNIYTGAISFGAGYSTNTGAFDTGFNGGGTDIAISKYTPDASDRIYGTYIGSSGSDYPHSLIVDYNNQMHVLGSTDGTNFPTTAGVFQPNIGGSADIIVAILSPDGADLVAATYMGGNMQDGRSNATSNYGDTYRGEIMIDQWGNTFVACGSQSANFPVTPNAAQTTLGGTQDGVLFKLNPDLTELIFSTYLGGTGSDMAFGVRIAEDASIYVCGTAATGTFPLGASPGAQATFGGGTNDGFLLHLNADATEILHGTFRGTNQVDHAFFIDIDDLTEKILIYGQTSGSMPITPAGTYGQANGGIFVTAYNYELNNIEYATTLGGSGGGFSSPMVPVAFMIDGCGYIYVSGYSAATGLPLTSNALFNTGGFYLGVLEPNAAGLNYGTYYTSSHVDGGTSRFDHNGIVYQGVCSGGGFNTTPTAWATGQTNSWDIGVFKIDFQTPSVNAQAAATPSATGCAPFEVNFTNLGSSALIYKWHFGDGDSSSLDEPSHIYTTPGTFDVALIAFDPASCNIADTAYLQVVVLSNTTVLHTIDQCAVEGPVVLDVTLPISGVSYEWNNGSTLPTQTVNTDGTYWVTSYHNNCAQVDSFIVDMLNPIFELPPDTLVCDNQLVLDITHPDATFYAWQDGTNSPIYTITQSGTYLALAVIQGCTVSDMINVTLADIDDVQLSDVAVCDGTPVILDATIANPNTTYLWSNGSTTPSVNITQSGTYSVTLTADGLCSDTDEIAVAYDNLVIDIGNDLQLCSGETALLNATPTGGNSGTGIVYTWSNGANTPTINIAESGIYAVTVSNATGCLAEDEMTLDISPAIPPFTLGDDWEVCKGEPVLLTAPAAVSGISRVWQDGSAADTYSPTTSGIYWLELRSECDTLRDEVTVTIKDLPIVVNPVMVPNGFSPNQDGMNDLFRPVVHGISGDYEFCVYNRWGQKIFSTIDPAEAWDGQAQDMECDMGVYAWYCRAYVVDCEGEQEIIQQGNITLLR
jgi:gliding motility-associated-like protein